MRDLKKLLHPTDFSNTARIALRYAVATAKRLDAQLNVVHVARHATPDGEPANGNLSQLESRMRHEISESAADYAPECEYRLIHDTSTADGILRFAEENDIDAIIIGTHGRRGFRRFILGSVTARVLNEATCDVVVVPRSAEVELEGRILVPVDLFGRSQGLVGWSLELAAQFSSDVDVLYVIDASLLMMPTPADRNMPLAGLATIEEVARDRLRDLVTHVPHGVDVATHVREGHPARQILEFANDQASAAIVLASSGMTPAERALLSGREVNIESKYLLGSITERVATNAGVPVWVRKRFLNGHSMPRNDLHELELTAS